jgi:hypothetical protein
MFIQNKKIMNVVYDLAKMPITYDFAIFLVIADCIRQLNKLDYIHLYIIKDEYRLKTLRDNTLSLDEKEWRLENIILPVTQRLDTIISVVLCKDRNLLDFSKMKNLYPNNKIKFNLYTHSIINKLFKELANPVIFDSSRKAKNIINKKYNKKYITCTLRQSNFDIQRNTDVDQIKLFNDYLKSKYDQIQLVVIPDHDYIFENKSNIEGIITDNVASINLDYRISLMQNAIINFGPSNGPVCFSFHCKKVKVFQYDLLKSDHTGKGVEMGWNLTNGFPINENYPWCQNESKLKWKEYNSINLINDFKNEYENSLF